MTWANIHANLPQSRMGMSVSSCTSSATAAAAAASASHRISCAPIVVVALSNCCCRWWCCCFFFCVLCLFIPHANLIKWTFSPIACFVFVSWAATVAATGANSVQRRGCGCGGEGVGNLIKLSQPTQNANLTKGQSMAKTKRVDHLNLSNLTIQF